MNWLKRVIREWLGVEAATNEFFKPAYHVEYQFLESDKAVRVPVDVR